MFKDTSKGPGAGSITVIMKPQTLSSAAFAFTNFTDCDSEKRNYVLLFLRFSLSVGYGTVLGGVQLRRAAYVYHLGHHQDIGANI